MKNSTAKMANNKISVVRDDILADKSSALGGVNK